MKKGDLVDVYQDVEQVMDASLDIAVTMLTSESNNDKLFPNAVHALATLAYSVPLLLPRISMNRASMMLRDILWVVTYEIMLEDKSKYTALVSSSMSEEGLALSDAERELISVAIQEAGNKTQYHIKQRLVLSAAQVIAISSYALTKLSKNCTPPLPGSYNCSKSIVLSCLAPLLSHGGYEV